MSHITDNTDKLVQRRKTKYAILSDIAYGADAGERQDRLDAHDKQDVWKIDSDLSGDDATVLQNRKTGEIVVSVRGTDLSHRKNTFRDLVSDVGIFFGVDKLGRRTRNINELTERVMKKYDVKPVMTGHSLGGKVAKNIAEKHGLQGHVFNVGSTPLDYKSKLLKKMYCKLTKCKEQDITHYHTNSLRAGTFDPISLSEAALGNTKSVYSAPVKGRGGAHTIKNYYTDTDQLTDFDSPTNKTTIPTQEVTTGLPLSELQQERQEDGL